MWGFRFDNTFAGSASNPVVAPHLNQDRDEGLKEGYARFHDRVDTLEDLGLIERVAYLCETHEPDAEIIHPYLHDGPGRPTANPLEADVGHAAHAAGLALLTSGQREYVAREELRLCPVPRHYTNVAMVSIARMTHRPHTSLTAQWLKEHSAKGAKYLEGYRSISEGATSKVFKVAQ